MKRTLAAFAVLCLLLAPAASCLQAQLLTVSASNLTDASGVRVSNATIAFTPALMGGRLGGFRKGGGSGQGTVVSVSQEVVNGGFNVLLADTATTSPVNLCYQVTVTDDVTGQTILQYPCVQPASSGAQAVSWCAAGGPYGYTCDFDRYTAPAQPGVQVTSGPKGETGATGPSGQQGVPGSTNVNTVTGDLNVPQSTNTQYVNLGTDPATGQPKTTTASSGNQSGAFANGFQQFNLNAYFTGAGWNTGYGFVNGGWSLIKAILVQFSTNTRGIAQGLTIFFTKIAAGDMSGAYIYVKGVAGFLSGSDEGVCGYCGETLEAAPFNGIVASTTGLGDTTPGFTYVNDKLIGEVDAERTVADMTLMLDISKGSLAGALAGAPSPFGGFLFQVPVSGLTVPQTTAYGTANQTVTPAGVTQDVGISTTLTLTLGRGSFAVGDLVSVAENTFSEQVRITAVGAPGATQAITLPLRYGGTSFIVFKGGIAGQAISSDAEHAFRRHYTAYRAFGSLDGTSIIYAAYIAGHTQDMPLSTNSGTSPFSIGDTTGGRSPNFHLYPYAEIVENTSATTAAPVLEPNGVAWAVGDTVVNAYGAYFHGHLAWFHGSQDTPIDETSGGYGLAVDVGGYGIGGNRYYLGHFGNTALLGRNGQPLYLENGGFAKSPKALDFTGVTGGFSLDTLPGAPGSQTSAFLFKDYARNPLTGAAVTGCYSIFGLPAPNPDVRWCTTDNSWNYQSLIGDTVRAKAGGFVSSKYTIEDGNYGSKFWMGTFPIYGLPSGYYAAWGGFGAGLGVLATQTGGSDPAFTVNTADHPMGQGQGNSLFSVTTDGYIEGRHNRLDGPTGAVIVAGTLTNAGAATGSGTMTYACFDSSMRLVKSPTPCVPTP